MSDIGENCRQEAASDIEAVAADWFGRRQFWDWTEQDQTELDEWLNRDLSHRVAYWRIEGAWTRTERLSAVHQPLRERRPTSGRQSSITFKMAAGALVAAVVAVGVVLWPSQVGKVYSTSVGETETLKLADGSSIELNTDTVLQVSVNDRHRSVVLQKGEAYFQIKHDASHPFVVTVDGNRLTDLGTKFLVRKEAGHVRVSLVEGKARLETEGAQPRSALLLPGDIAVATANAISLTKHSNADLSSDLSWRNGMLVFDNTSLGEAAAEFNRYNRIRLVIDDPSVADIPIAGKFPTNGVDRFADVVTHVFGLKVRDSHGVMAISRQ